MILMQPNCFDPNAGVEEMMKSLEEYIQKNPLKTLYKLQAVAKQLDSKLKANNEELVEGADTDNLVELLYPILKREGLLKPKSKPGEPLKKSPSLDSLDSTDKVLLGVDEHGNPGI